MSRQWHQYAIALLGFVVVLALVQHSAEQIDFITVTLSLCVIILYESNTHWDSSVAQKLVLLLNLEVEDLVSFAGVRASWPFVDACLTFFLIPISICKTPTGMWYSAECHSLPSAHQTQWECANHAPYMHGVWLKAFKVSRQYCIT